ncbi:uncharacterized protein N7482_004068 [Penicillium canariense]|uniref:Biogenesis of lysosome-related organelles complex 1 subunit 1 n=1 Tax=Penicillium canariense TaxID=189055 RepID=A0A9W9LP12_9EURO|nr:uncharacterized protein N7482_004068 [Penicillium canariense]KAJ5168474.1 hypothetical protein N7482_004068 [Penicillium canariense]
MTDPTPTNAATSAHTNTETEDQQKKEALAAFTATLHSVGTNLEAPLRDRAATITANEAALQRQEAELAEHTARLAKQNAQWMGLADETREGLKEIGDVQNWAEMIERDLLVLEEMMDGVEREDCEREDCEREDCEREDCEREDCEREGALMDVDANGYQSDAQESYDERDGHQEMQNGDALVNGKGKKAKGSESRGWLRWW